LWAKVSRLFMNFSRSPSNPLEYLIAYLIRIVTFVYAKIWYFMALFIVAWYLKKRFYK